MTLPLSKEQIEAIQARAEKAIEQHDGAEALYGLASRIESLTKNEKEKTNG